MNIYTLTESDQYKTLVDEEHVGGLQEFASSLAFNRALLPIQEFVGRVIYNPGDSKKKADSDFYTFFRPVLIASESAIGKLSALAKLPKINVVTPRKGDTALYVPNVVSGLFNFEQSDYDEGPSGYVVYRTVLNSTVALTEQIFRIPESPMVLFVTQDFKDEVLLNGLKGLVFREIKISGPGPAIPPA
jgi:hypothetical protein